MDKNRWPGGGEMEVIKGCSTPGPADPPPPGRSWAVRATASTAAASAAAASWGIVRWLATADVAALWQLLAGGIGGGAVYLAGCYALRVREVRWALRMARRVTGRRFR